MSENNKDSLSKFSLANASSLSLLIMVLSFFFVGSLYTRVKFLEKELATYTGGSKVAGVRVEAKGNDTNQQEPSQPSAVTPELKGEIKLTTEDHVNGKKDARILLFEYSDMECPYCKKFHPTAQKIVDSYKGDVAWVYRHLPLPFHANAAKEAEASECANELGGNDAFWKMTATIFEKMPALELDQLPALASGIGLDEAKFKTCLDSGKYEKKTQGSLEEGTKAGINSTPTSVIYDLKTGKSQSVIGALPYEDLRKSLDTFISQNK